ncbi:MAG: nucleotidyl transferase [Ignavibacteriae bacterium]|nr:MAG: nucleotidyl transferase [Ignavibacteriota bacterium]
MKAVILAAGIASRLRPLTDNTPKCLLELGEDTILGRTIKNLIKNNIQDFIIVTGYLQEQIIDYVKNNFPKINIEFIYNPKYDSTNNIYSLWLTKKSVKDSDILLLDSDILFDYRIIEKLLNSKHKNVLAVKSVHELGEEEIKVILNDDKSISEISKVINPKLAIGESIGIEKFSKEYSSKLFSILDEMILKENKVNIFYEAAFEKSIKKGSKIYIEDVENLKCMELDTAEDIEAAKDEIIKEIK